jgi:hypothetical protein
MKKLSFLTLILLILLIITGCIQSSNEAVIDNETDGTVRQESLEPLEIEPVSILDDYNYHGDLVDVANGNATGKAYAKQSEESYMLYATFENLPDITDEFFYEGWVVRKSPLSVLSTGKAVIKDGRYENNYLADGDLADHDFYVLTVEPDDGDPAPADHVLEGYLK